MPATPLGAAPPEEGMIHASFSPSQLQGETYVLQIAQSKDGQIIAGGERIVYYENNEWQIVSGFRKPAIRSLLVDGTTLWVASLNEIGKIKLPIGAGSRYERLSIPEIANAGEFWQLAKIGGLLIATTNEEVWFIDPASQTARHTKLPNKSRLILLPFDGRVLVAQPGRGLWEVTGGELQPLPSPPSGTGNELWLWTDGNFVLTGHALYKREGPDYRVVAQTRRLTDEGIITSATLWDKYLAISTATKGLALIQLDSGRITYVTRASVLPTLALMDVFKDRAGKLWIGSRQGITVFEPPRFGHEMTLENSPISAARIDGLFISYEDHGEYYPEHGKDETLPRTYETIPSRHGPIFGLWEKIRVGGSEIDTIGNRTGTMVELPDGNLLTTSTERLYFVDVAAGKSRLVSGPAAEITGFAIRGDTLWAATIDGNLYRAPTAPPFTFAKAAKLPDSSAAKLHLLGQTLVVASADSVRFGEHFRVVDHTAGLHNPLLASTDEGTLWLLGEQAGEQRLGRLVSSGDSVGWETVDAKGLPQLSETHSLTASGRTLTICGDNKILELETGALTATYRLDPPQLQFSIRDSREGDATILDAPPSELGAEQNSLSFSGSLPYDEFGERPRFERRLLPTETAWIPTKGGEKVSYPSLSPLTYTLEVRATNLGHVGPVVSHVFTVLPPWYASRGAVGGYVLLAALGFYFLYRFRTHQIRERNLQLERTVEERTRELAAASAAKTEFLASMSHEIRNPMNGVIGLVNILRDGAVAPKQAHTLKLLHSCAEQLRSTVDDILDFSKIEAGRLTLESSFFDLLDTLEAAAATVDPTGRAIRFLERPPASLTLQGDAAKLRQIFANYLSNALKYGVPPEARVSTILTPAEGGVQLTLSVTSSGPTIDKDTLDQFFESFTRGTEAVERNIHGTGLGLAICKRYAQAMGGDVGAVSTNGETTFYLNVPFEKVSAAAIAHPVAAPPSTLPARALAIEDEDYNRIVLGSILAKMNYTVDWATTGVEALRLARENGYDIVLTDYRLPDTNGVELTRQILRLCPDPKPAVFAVTAYSTRERRDECLNAGMAGFISKPITLEKLRTTLASWGDRQLTTISLEASRLTPRPLARIPTEIAAAWTDLRQTARTDAKQAAELAHRLNNLCRALDHIDLAEQLELLEGVLERGEPAEKLIQAIASLVDA